MAQYLSSAASKISSVTWYVSITSWLIPVFRLFSWCSHSISLSSSQPQSAVLCVILLALFFAATFVLQQTVNICFHWSTKTLLPSAFWQLPKRMSCTLGNDQKTRSYTRFSGFFGLFCLLRVKCQLHNLNSSQLSFHNFLQVSLLW